MFVKKIKSPDTVNLNGTNPRVYNAVVDTLTSEDSERDRDLLTLLRSPPNDSLSTLDSALPLSRNIARASAPLVWRALLDEVKDGNMTAIRLYFDIFGRDLGKTDDEDLSPSSEEINSLRDELFREDG